MYRLLDIFLPFCSVHGVLKARMLKRFAIPFSSGPHFVRTLHYDPSVLGGPTWHGSQFQWASHGCGPCDQFGLFSVIVVFILSPLWRMMIRGLQKLPDGRDWGGNGLRSITTMNFIHLFPSIEQFVDSWNKPHSGWGTHVYLWQIHFDIWQN